MNIMQLWLGEIFAQTISRWRVLLSLLLSVSINTILSAQVLYKSVGADGKITYSDVPPPKESKIVATKKNEAIENNSHDLPYELKQISQKYPVILYSGKICVPCDEARAHFARRGVPYTEKTIESNDDLAKLKQVSGQTRLPVISVGSQILLGYGFENLDDALDVAGYPKQSRLPRNYKMAISQNENDKIKVLKQSDTTKKEIGNFNNLNKLPTESTLPSPISKTPISNIRF